MSQTAANDSDQQRQAVLAQFLALSDSPRPVGTSWQTDRHDAPDAASPTGHASEAPRKADLSPLDIVARWTGRGALVAVAIVVVLGGAIIALTPSQQNRRFSGLEMVFEFGLVLALAMLILFVAVTAGLVLGALRAIGERQEAKGGTANVSPVAVALVTVAVTLLVYGAIFRIGLLSPVLLALLVGLVLGAIRAVVTYQQRVDTHHRSGHRRLERRRKANHP